MSFAACSQKMHQAGLSSWQIEAFRRQYESLVGGAQTQLFGHQLQEVGPLASYSELTEAEQALLSQVVVIKLNGGLGTSMGLELPKGLLEVRPGLTFLDVTTQQLDQLGQVPLLLMNSFHTRPATLQHLGDRPNFGLPLDFVQSKVPKLRADNFEPVEHPQKPELEWCPPGHGELYSALSHSLDLAALGYRYAFVSNIDNLGAQLDLKILTWFAKNDYDFAMEVTRRTEQDRKGGHLARLQGRLCLRERAQCPSEELSEFEDIHRYSQFNTNNLWFRLDRLQIPELPLIVNRKTVDPTDPQSTPVIQLETAMGAAIQCFERSAALEVPRSRFLPVKTLADLLIVRSDLVEFQEQGRIHVWPLPSIRLAVSNYADFERQFPCPPSLRSCTALTVGKSSLFDRPQKLVGEVELA